MIKFLVFSFIILLASADDVTDVSCDYCTSNLLQLAANIQASPDTMAQMGDQSSQGCDQVTNKDQRMVCLDTLDDNYPLFLQNFLAQPGDSAHDFCAQMGYC